MGKHLAFALITLLLLTGCGSTSTDSHIDSGNGKVGIIRHLNVTEEAISEIYQDKTDKKFKHQYVFFDDLNSMIMALEARQVNEISTYRSVADYLVRQNPKFAILEQEPTYSDAFCCAMLEKNTLLKKAFDNAIKQMIADGTLAKMTRIYISEVANDMPTPPLSMPHFDDAPTIRVGVTGDLPLLDYINVGGKPSGFNASVLAETSKRIWINFELVNIASGARALALESGEVDVIFWAIVPTSDLIPFLIDTPKGVIVTTPYFSDEIVHVKLKE